MQVVHRTVEARLAVELRAALAVVPTPIVCALLARPAPQDSKRADVVRRTHFVGRLHRVEPLSVELLAPFKVPFVGAMAIAAVAFRANLVRVNPEAPWVEVRAVAPVALVAALPRRANHQVKRAP
jgi:hypothetical protein